MRALIILNAKKLWGRSSADDDAIIAIDGKIVFVGKSVVALEKRAELASSCTAQTVIDCEGERTVYPGFIDSHVHFTDSGRRLVGKRYVSLRNITGGRAEVVSRIQKHIAKHNVAEGEWLLGGDWNENDWTPAELAGNGFCGIGREWLDEASTSHPLFLSRWDSHSAACNSLALRLAGIDNSTPNPVGGTIVRDVTTGEATGILREHAMRFVKAIFPTEDTDESLTAASAAAQEYLLSRGVTMCATMTSTSFSNIHEIAFLAREASRGALKMRVRCAVRVNEMAALEALVSATPLLQSPSSKVLVGPVKIFADGSLGSRTCCMKHAFADAGTTGNKGMLLAPREQLHHDVQTVLKATIAAKSRLIRWQCCVHAIGDEAASEVIAAAEELSSQHEFGIEAVRQTRFRIEHCQIITNPDDIARLAAVGGVGSVQPLQLVYDGPTVVTALGVTRANRDTYPLRSLLHGGVPLCGGSDWMIVEPDVTSGVVAATTRLALAPNGSASKYFQWEPSEALTLDESIASYTSAGAWANNCEGFLGSIEEGFAADFAIVDETLEQLAAKALVEQNGLIGEASRFVWRTIVDGEIVFERA